MADVDCVMFEVRKLGPIDGRHVLVLRGCEPEMARALAGALIDQASARGATGPVERHVPLVVHVDGDQDLALLDEDAMRDAGWVRMEGVSDGQE